MEKLFYRVCHEETFQGLWYTFEGNFAGLIHKDFNFCLHNELAMDFDEEIVGWLSATTSLETLHEWFPIKDIIELQKHGYYIHTFKAEDFKFYERFQHTIIKQDTSKMTQKIIL